MAIGKLNMGLNRRHTFQTGCLNQWNNKYVGRVLVRKKVFRSCITNVKQSKTLKVSYSTYMGMAVTIATFTCIFKIKC